MTTTYLAREADAQGLAAPAIEAGGFRWGCAIGLHRLHRVNSGWRMADGCSIH